MSGSRMPRERKESLLGDGERVKNIEVNNFGIDFVESGVSRKRLGVFHVTT